MDNNIIRLDANRNAQHILAGSNDYDMLFEDRLPLHHNGVIVGWAIETSVDTWDLLYNNLPEPTWWGYTMISTPNDRIEALWLTSKPVPVDCTSKPPAPFNLARWVGLALLCGVRSLDPAARLLSDITSLAISSHGTYGPLWTASSLCTSMENKRLWQYTHVEPGKSKGGTNFTLDRRYQLEVQRFDD